MTASACAIAKKLLIRPFEGYRREAYVDPASGGEPITVGEGTTRYRATGLIKYGRAKVFLGDTLEPGEAEEELDAAIKYFAQELKEVLLVPLTDNQLAAMISFAYNMGIGGSAKQIHRLNSGKIGEFVDFHMKYVNPGTHVEAG